MGENGYSETLLLHQDLGMFSFRECSFLPLLPRLSLLATTYFTQESAFLLFPFERCDVKEDTESYNKQPTYGHWIFCNLNPLASLQTSLLFLNLTTKRFLLLLLLSKQTPF